MRKRKTPIVFIPGLFGSMSNIIIPGTGNWSFGLSAFVYEPFIMMLESMGYERNKDLFICFMTGGAYCFSTQNIYYKRLLMLKDYRLR